MFEDRPYIIPKETNCGTYKVDSPTVDNACECPDAGKAVTYWNEITILRCVNDTRFCFYFILASHKALGPGRERDWKVCRWDNTQN